MAGLDRLLRAARELSPTRPMRGRTLHTLLGLLVSTGLRSGEALRDYAAARDAAFPHCTSPAFFVSLRGGRLSSAALSTTFGQARARAGLDTDLPRPVRPHDLRHRFVVTRLAMWHREGVDVQARLPLLATYPGHVRYSDTAYYVTGTAELLGCAAERAFGRQTGPS